LRERREDILPLIEFFTQKFSNDANKKTISYSKETIDIFLKYNYPGNVRELENIVQRAVVISRGDMITTNDLPIGLKNLPAESTTPLNQDTMDLSNRVESLEKDLVFDALRQTNGNQSKAAILLGISERNLRYRLEKWGMKK
jgi:two-component system NtrC family response regulator